MFWEGNKDQGIYLSRSADAGNLWTGPELVVAPKAGVPIWAPVLHVQVRAPGWWQMQHCARSIEGDVMKCRAATHGSSTRRAGQSAGGGAKVGCTGLAEET